MTVYRVVLDEAGVRVIPHVNYPHTPGYLHDCPACESRCHCEGTTNSPCVYHDQRPESTDADILREIGMNDEAEELDASLGGNF